MKKKKRAEENEYRQVVICHSAPLLDEPCVSSPCALSSWLLLFGGGVVPWLFNTTSGACLYSAAPELCCISDPVLRTNIIPMSFLFLLVLLPPPLTPPSLPTPTSPLPPPPPPPLLLHLLHLLHYYCSSSPNLLLWSCSVKHHSSTLIIILRLLAKKRLDMILLSLS